MEQQPKTIGDYRIKRELGRGGMAIVYHAHDTKNQRDVALKILPPTMVDRSSVARFHREGVAQSKLRHPNIVEVYEAGAQDGVHYIAMEFVEGKTVRAMIKQHGRLSVEKASEILLETCRALDYAHEMGFIHRDIKSANIMVNKSGQVKLMDFGLVRITGATLVTQSGVVVGTPEYMSPEQISGNEIDQRSDIYSLGITMYEMLAGKLPFESSNSQGLIMMHRYEQPQPLHDLVPNLPPVIEYILNKTITKEPAERFQTAAEMTEAIEKFLKAPPTQEELSSMLEESTLEHLATELLIKASSASGGETFSGRPSQRQLMINCGVIKSESFSELYKKHFQTGKPLRECAIELGCATEQQILQFLTSAYGIERLENIDQLKFHDRLRELIPEKFAQKCEAVPVASQAGELVVAMVNPLDVYLDDYLTHICDMKIKKVAVGRSEFKLLFDKVYQTGNVYEGILEELGATEESDKIEVVDDEEPIELGEETGSEAPIVKLVNYLIDQAVRERASDIHIEPDEEKLRVRYRIDGALSEKMCPPKQLQAPIISRIKIMADMDIAERRIPQDGRIKLRVQEKNVDFRISTLPGIHGEKAVIRILDESQILLGLNQLGFNADLLKKWERMITRPYGIILVTGPTGGGKTTTLYSTLSRINTIDTNIITVEDPVEYRLEGITQVQVNLKAGVNFASGLRSIFRQDPDIIMVGEMRDLETAQISIKAALTGHLVFSTLHTNDAPGAITRLLDIGIAPYLVASSLIGVMAQRLVRMICPSCKQAYTPSQNEREEACLEGEEEIKFYRGQGCDKCQNTGYRGRMPLFELMEVTDEIKRLIITKSASNQIKNASIKNGLSTLWDEGIKKVLEGKTTFDEVKRKTSSLKEVH